MEAIDFAYSNFIKIKDEIANYEPTISTESDARIKIIDRILVEVLGFEYSDISTEPYSGTGYIDYLIKHKGVSKLIIEAKKDEADFGIETVYSGRGYMLDGPMFSKKEVNQGLSQTIYYAAQESVELGCLTNGRTWIIFRANRLGDGKKIRHGKGIVFSNLDSIQKEFKLFYQLLSPFSLQSLEFRAIFQEIEGHEIRTKDFSKSIVTEDTLRLLNADFSEDFDRVMTTFFQNFLATMILNF